MALSDYSHVRTALLVKIEVAEYLQTDGSLQAEDLLFTDHYTDLDYAGDNYTALGDLVSVSSTVAELTPTSNTCTIVIAGIPNRSLREILESKIKSSPVTVYRQFMDQDGQLLTGFTNPVGKFSGFVNNYSLQEEWDSIQRISSNTIVLDCASTVDLLSKKTAGRQTNSGSMKKHYPNDVSFDRVQALSNAKINFGE